MRVGRHGTGKRQLRGGDVVFAHTVIHPRKYRNGSKVRARGPECPTSYPLSSGVQGPNKVMGMNLGGQF